MKFCSLVGLGLACFYQCVARDCHYKKRVQNLSTEVVVQFV